MSIDLSSIVYRLINHLKEVRAGSYGVAETDEMVKPLP